MGSHYFVWVGVLGSDPLVHISMKIDVLLHQKCGDTTRNKMQAPFTNCICLT